MERRLIIEQFDPERPKPGGIDTCIRGLVRYCPEEIELRIAGVDAVGNKKLGEWSQCNIGGRPILFMPLARLDHANLRRKLPHSLHVAKGLLRYRPLRDADVVQSHRINTGAVAMRLYAHARHVQFLHWSGADVVVGNESFFRRSPRLYRWFERSVIPRTVDTVVFNKAGADRLRKLSHVVRFSPTWYDPEQFFPAESESSTKNRILWAGRIEPVKNPELAVEVMAKLPRCYSLTVAGSGTLESVMRESAKVSDAAGRIRFVGPVPKSEMGELMRSHDLLMMTSRSEGFPRAVVEGLASGLPVVTTAAGEPNGLVKTGVNGARVETDDADSFVRAVQVASQVSAAAARASVSHLSADAVVPSVLRIPQSRD